MRYILTSAILSALIADIDMAAPDHIAITGDLTMRGTRRSRRQRPSRAVPRRAASQLPGAAPIRAPGSAVSRWRGLQRRCQRLGLVRPDRSAQPGQRRTARRMAPQPAAVEAGRAARLPLQRQQDHHGQDEWDDPAR